MRWPHSGYFISIIGDKSNVPVSSQSARFPKLEEKNKYEPITAARYLSLSVQGWPPGLKAMVISPHWAVVVDKTT